VQPFAGVARQRRQPVLDVEMDVLEFARPREFAALDLAFDGRHSTLDRREVGARKHADRRQHAGVGKRPRDIDCRQPAVEVDGRREALDALGHRLAEAARPAAGGGGRRLGRDHGGDVSGARTIEKHTGGACRRDRKAMFLASPAAHADNGPNRAAGGLILLPAGPSAGTKLASAFRICGRL
jgi:hypothetical protein